MIEFIQRLFTVYGFEKIGSSNEMLFSFMDEKNEKTMFWVIEKIPDLSRLLETQAELFNKCKAACSHNALDKNISYLILFETDNTISNRDLKNEIMSIEEDTYFFKKHVLHYTDLEYKKFQLEMAETDILHFITTQTASHETFKTYKQNPLLESWWSLFYRMIIKLSFIPIHVDVSDGLDSLFSSNTNNIEANKNKKLINFDRNFFDLLSSKQLDDIKNFEADEFLSLLMPALIGDTTNED